MQKSHQAMEVCGMRARFAVLRCLMLLSKRRRREEKHCRRMFSRKERQENVFVRITWQGQYAIAVFVELVEDDQVWRQATQCGPCQRDAQRRDERLRIP